MLILNLGAKKLLEGCETGAVGEALKSALNAKIRGVLK